MNENPRDEISFLCPFCHVTSPVSRQMLGQPSTCTHCGRQLVLVVPGILAARERTEDSGTKVNQAASDSSDHHIGTPTARTENHDLLQRNPLLLRIVFCFLFALWLGCFAASFILPFVLRQRMPERDGLGALATGLELTVAFLGPQLIALLLGAFVWICGSNIRLPSARQLAVVPIFMHVCIFCLLGLLLFLSVLGGG